MKSVDVIGLLDSGRKDAVSAYMTLLDAGVNATLLNLVPVHLTGSGLYLDLYDIYEKWTRHASAKAEARLKKIPSEQHIDELVGDPKMRLFGKPNLDSVALLVDDYYYTGSTMANSILDVITVGYKPDNVFYHFRYQMNHPHTTFPVFSASASKQQRTLQKYSRFPGAIERNFPEDLLVNDVAERKMDVSSFIAYLKE